MSAPTPEPRSYTQELLADLCDPVYAVEFLGACLQESRETFLSGLRHVAEAYGLSLLEASVVSLSEQLASAIIFFNTLARADCKPGMAGDNAWHDFTEGLRRVKDVMAALDLRTPPTAKEAP